MKIALAQLNPTVGDLAGNADLVRQAAVEAAGQYADLLVVSELMLSGYPPRDLLLRQGFVDACDEVVAQLASELPAGLGVLVGHPTARGIPQGRIANAASLLVDGQIAATVQKALLPNYDVFDERRYFRAADHVSPVSFRGMRLGIHICEDAWWGQPGTPYHDEPARGFDPIAELAAAGVDLFVNLSASPFEIRKRNRRQQLVARHAELHGRPFLFVNQIGGNDDLVFDGHSFAVTADGRIAAQLPGFETSLQCLELDTLAAPPAEGLPGAGSARQEHADLGDMLDALILGLRDYVRKCGFTDCVLGLSGGIDSTLAAYIAAQALGPQHVHGIAMPSRHSSEHSIADARLLAENLGIDCEQISIDAVHRAYEQTDLLCDDLSSQPGGLADQNLQARIRGAIVMTRSNRHNWLALATGNKSELAVGYCTLYGDMCGGFAVLSDVFKRDVYALARYINDEREQRAVLPEHSITKPPSAELAPGQFDQDTLPDYPTLDAVLVGLIEREESVATLCRSLDPDTVRWVATRVDRNEFKRRQMPPGIKLSARAFGTGRRMPIAARYTET